MKGIQPVKKTLVATSPEVTIWKTFWGDSAQPELVPKPRLLCNTIQMMHGCKWNIQICCPEVDMSSRGRSPSDDMSTEGQHI